MPCQKQRSISFRYNVIDKYAFGIFALFYSFYGFAQSFPDQYKGLQKRLQTGWHTYNTNSVLSHVLMPEAFSFKLSLKSNRVGLYGYMGDAYISAKVPRAERIHPIAYSRSGDYTELVLNWDGNSIRVQSASDNGEIVLLATPEKTTATQPHLIVEAGFLWNAKGFVAAEKGVIKAKSGHKEISIRGTKTDPVLLSLNTPYLSLFLDGPVGVYSGKPKTLKEVRQCIEQKKRLYEKGLARFGDQATNVKIIQNAIGWNTIYDPVNRQVITPVSRYWNEAFGGPYVLFDWDTYFGAYMASSFNKDVAFSNAIAITKSLTFDGFVPNYTAGGKKASLDRSQPPVGSVVVREIYRQHPEKWLLQYLFKDLLVWNRWWPKSRTSLEGWLCWGSNAFGDPSANTWQGAAYESGLDNSPMYDSVPFNSGTHLMELADVGLHALYILDCEALADIADVLGEEKTRQELLQRADSFKVLLAKLWHQPSGQYLNFRTDIKKFNTTTSPTTFYPLLIGAPDSDQAQRMVEGHLQNKNEYAGEWIVPSCPINHPAYKEQDYWRGRIWGPMNLLIYLGLRQYHFPDLRKEVVRRSTELLLKNYSAEGYVYENYNAITGEGRRPEERITASDNFYHWGALLAFISIVESGYVGEPLKKLKAR